MLDRIEFADGRFVAVGRHHPYDPEPGPTAIYTSGDGLRWEPADLGEQTQVTGLSDVAFGNGRWVALGWDSYTVQAQDLGYPDEEVLVLVSEDGVHWEPGGDGLPDWILRELAFGDGVFVASRYDGQMAWSTDGLSWQGGMTVDGGDGVHLDQSIAFGAGRFVKPGETGDELVFATSEDGVNWVVGEPVDGPVNHLGGLRFVDGRFVGGASFDSFCEGHCPPDDDADLYLAESADGRTWTLTLAERSMAFTGMAVGEDVYLSTIRGEMLRSVDFWHWDEVRFPRGTYVGDVAFGVGLFVAAGEDGIWTSPDGETWDQTLEYDPE